jgi:uncharacterized peroxidase-related enzyme
MASWSLTVTPAEREMIAAFVSSQNQCSFCLNSHAAAARCLLGGERQVADQVVRNYRTARVSDKLKALLAIAEEVRRDGRLVMPEDIARARAAGADDQAIHDTVLITAAFCMFNRYVDGLGTWAPDDAAAYEKMGAELAEKGYQRDSRAP